MFSAPLLAPSTAPGILAAALAGGELEFDLSRAVAEAAAADVPSEWAALAQDAPEGLPEPPPPPWRLLSGAGALFGGDQSDVHAAGFVAFETDFAERLELSLEFAGYFINQEKPGEAFAGAFTPTFRYTFHEWQDDAWSAFIDVGIGVMQSTEQITPNGTEFNFTPRAGVGLSWSPPDETYRLIGGARWQHFSNARIDGGDENESFDSIMLYLGVSIPF